MTDLARLQGRVLAEDRSWQLHRDRLLAEGRAAEALGPTAVGHDLLLRRALVAETARKAYAALDPADQDLAAAFADGVTSAWADGVTCPEFQLLDVEPESWPAWMPLAILLGNHLLFGTFGDKLWRHRVRTLFGDQALRLLDEEGAANGSNSALLAGTMTASGAPLLAGDPHRDFEIPNVYAQVHLVAPGVDVLGLTFAGVPGVQHFGHSGTVAWAVTNAAADTQDLYLETLRTGAEGVQALGPTGWEPTRSVRAEIVVRGAEPLVVDLVETARGPIIIDTGAEVLSLRTPARVLGDVGFGAIRPLLRARTVAEVDAALDGWVQPVNNWMIAGSDGAILHRVGGRVPHRAPRCFVAPVPAEDPAVAWDGWVDPLPRRSDGDLLITANDRVTADYDTLGAVFSPAFRAARIAALLQGRSGLDADSVSRVFLDVRQTAGDRLLELVGASTLTGPGRAVRDRLLDWDREMAADSAEAALFVAVREAVAARLAEPLTDLARHDYGEVYDGWFRVTARVTAALPTLLAQPRPFGLDPARLVTDALAQVGAGAVPPDWGQRHRFHPARTPVPAQLPALPLAGDSRTVAAAAATFGSDTCPTGSVARYVWDLADRAASRWVIPLGASGDPADPHFADQLVEWAAGRLIPVDPGD